MPCRGKRTIFDRLQTAVTVFVRAGFRRSGEVVPFSSKYNSVFFLLCFFVVVLAFSQFPDFYLTATTSLTLPRLFFLPCVFAVLVFLAAETTGEEEAAR